MQAKKGKLNAKNMSLGGSKLGTGGWSEKGDSVEKNGTVLKNLSLSRLAPLDEAATNTSTTDSADGAKGRVMPGAAFVGAAKKAEGGGAQQKRKAAGAGAVGVKNKSLTKLIELGVSQTSTTDTTTSDSDLSEPGAKKGGSGGALRKPAGEKGKNKAAPSKKTVTLGIDEVIEFDLESHEALIYAKLTKLWRA